MKAWIQRNSIELLGSVLALICLIGPASALVISTWTKWSIGADFMASMCVGWHIGNLTIGREYRRLLDRLSDRRMRKLLSELNRLAPKDPEPYQ